MRRAASPVAPNRSSSSSARAAAAAGGASSQANSLRFAMPMARRVEAQFRQLAARDLRRIMLRTPAEIFECVEADHAAGRGTTGAAGALRCRRLADSRDGKRRQSGPRRIARDARQTAVDDGGDALDRDGAFRDVGRENHLLLGRERDGAILFGGRKVAMQRKHQQTVMRRDGLAFTRGSPDLGRARQKHQNVARVLLFEKQLPPPTRPAFSSAAAEYG